MLPLSSATWLEVALGRTATCRPLLALAVVPLVVRLFGRVLGGLALQVDDRHHGQLVDRRDPIERARRSRRSPGRPGRRCRPAPLRPLPGVVGDASRPRDRSRPRSPPRRRPGRPGRRSPPGSCAAWGEPGPAARRRPARACRLTARASCRRFVGGAGCQPGSLIPGARWPGPSGPARGAAGSTLSSSSPTSSPCISLRSTSVSAICSSASRLASISA